MTDDRLPLAALPAKTGDADCPRAAAEEVVQFIMEADVEGQIGAVRHERTGERLNHCDGFRDRTLHNGMGSLALRIPKLRRGNAYPPLLERRNTSEKALVPVTQKAWISGVPMRRVCDLARHSGGTIVLAYLSRLPEARFRVTLSDVLKSPEHPNRLLADITFLNGVIEPIILERPEQRFWLDDAV